jgi:ribokinase
VFPGGKGADQAVVCAKLSRTRTLLQDASLAVMMAGAVGEDLHGTALLESLTSYGGDVSEVARNAASGEFSTTGSAVIM